MIGNCEINKNGEITKDTIVCISCEGSGSVKRPVLYRFQQLIKSDYFTFASSTDPLYCGKIPFATEEFQLCVDVTDNMGSKNGHCYFRLFFKAESPNSIFTTLEAIASGTDSDIANALKTGDPNEISVTVQSVARLLAEGHWIAVQLVDAVSSVEVTDPNSLRQVTSTINALALASSDLPRSGQEKLLSIIKNVSRNVRDISKTASKDDSVTVGRMVLDSFFNIMTGIQSQTDNPLPGDAITDLKEMDYDTSIEAGGKSLSIC
ncbi:unnamed protein product [Rodentolepis nana]|uniref:REJ domain-containing protein n=1 Tax=Rodentolepis nana TaxID=102285 RepID=A0A0R3THI7_RODNA|nr:unnamed protein product [Rodentolepis nana]